MNDIKEKTEFDELQELIERKKKNLLWQKKLREESKELDIAIARHPRVNDQVIQLSNTGGSHRVILDDFDADIKVEYRLKKSWDQDYVAKVHAEGKVPANLWPFQIEYKEDKRKTSTLAEQHPSHYYKLAEGLTTEISDRPYVSFVAVSYTHLTLPTSDLV